MTNRRALAIAVLGVLLAGCGDDPKPPTSPAGPASVERLIAPKATDPNIDIGLEPHVAINPSPSVAARGKLFVFLPGTGALPTHYRLILRLGAARGYHAIGLNYPNDDAVGILCDGSAEPDCQWNVRREVITGIDSSPLVDVNVANSIGNRLRKVLTYLHAQYPDEGWGQYLEDGVPVWSNMEFAGHSQGGGHAAAIAKLHAVYRAVYFSSPADWISSTGAPPAWISRPTATEVSRQYGFTHTMDGTVPFAHLVVTWPALGLGAFGAPVSVDNENPPYTDSRQLTTSAVPHPIGGGGLPYHAATVFDAATPLTGSGTPLYAPVWTYLCFP